MAFITDVKMCKDRFPKARQNDQSIFPSDYRVLMSFIDNKPASKE